jgi:hypothetical protein
MPQSTTTLEDGKAPSPSIHLPTELRLEIFRLLLKTQEPISITPDGKRDGSTRLQVQLFRVSKLFHTEATDVFLENRFSFQPFVGFNMLSVLKGTNAHFPRRSFFQHVRNVRIDLGTLLPDPFVLAPIQALQALLSGNAHLRTVETTFLGCQTASDHITVAELLALLRPIQTIAVPKKAVFQIGDEWTDRRDHSIDARWLKSLAEAMEEQFRCLHGA